MKNIFYLLLAIILFTSCSEKPKIVEVTVQNPSSFDRIVDMVEINLNDIKEKLTLSDTSAYIVKNERGEIIPSQITSDSKLIFHAGVKSGETVVYAITTGSKQDYKILTYGRFVSERKDDFAWENDRVAFRIYGPALVAVDGPSNGLDIWYKRTSDMVIDKWYKNDLSGVASYHNDNGEGLDDYKVGRSLGAGAMAPYQGDKLWLNENFVSQEILDNGPLRTTFKLTYKDLEVDGQNLSETRTISIDAGAQLTRITQEYGGAGAMPVAAGIVKRNSGDSIIIASDKTYLIYVEPTTDKVDGVFLGLVFPKGMDQTSIDTYKIINPITKKEDAYSHVLAINSYKQNTPLTYYTGYGWSKFGFEDVSEFQKYLENFSEELKQPLSITIK